MKALQMKRLKADQGGFTLLELLVVITLIAALAVGALIAYDGVGDKAQAAAGADANVKLDNAIRQYKAVSNVYPNQWDNLVAEDASLIKPLPTALTNVVRRLTLAGEAASNVTTSLGKAGIVELQYLTNWDGPNTAGVIPNLAHNESFNPANAREIEHYEFDEDGVLELNPIQNIAVVPGRTNCTATGVTGNLPAAPATTVFTSGQNYIQNQYSDALEQDECHLVVALGFGSDAAASTATSSVSIGKAPSFAKTDPTDPTRNINPNEHYSRFIGLFLVASDKNDSNAIDSDEYLDKARLIAVIAPDGTLADQNLATAVRQE